MGDLFTQWRNSVGENSKRAVHAYTQELPDFRRVAADPRRRADMLDFAVFLRERTVDLVAQDEGFTTDDLDLMVAAGRERGAAGISLADQRHVLLLHTSLTLREVHEAAERDGLDNLMHTLRWLPPAGLAAQAAYARGFLQGQQARLPVAERVRALTDLLLADDALAGEVATGLGMTVPARCVVLVVRVAQARAGQSLPPRTDIVTAILARHWLPLRWATPAEFVALVGADGVVSAEDRALAVGRDFGQLVGLPCAVGAATGTAGELAATLGRARQVCQVAPLETLSGRVYYATDLFAELGVARVPPVESWLRDVARRLAAGPQLVPTLESFYRNNMARTLTAAALCIHPRTLDYRLRRVHELTGLDPVSVRGVRILSTTVTRALAGAWT